MKKLLWIALPVMAVAGNEILSLVILSVITVVVVAVLLQAAAEHNI
jgi:hypothetical protein